MAALLLSLGLNGILTRVLPPSEFAFFGVLISFLTISVLLAQGGYQTGIVKSIGEAIAAGPNDAIVGRNLSAGLLATGIGSVFVVVLTYFFAGALLPPVNGEHIAGIDLYLVLILVPLMSFNVLLAEALRGAGRVGWAASVTALGQHGGVVRAGAFLILLMIFVAFDQVTLRRILFISMLSSIFVVTFIFFFIRQNFNWSRNLVGGWLEMWRNLSLNFRFLIGQFAQMLSGQYTVTIVSGMVFSGELLAMFVAAQSLRVLLQAPHTLFAGAVPSLMIEAHQRSERIALEGLLRYGSSMAFIMTLAIILPFISLGPWFFAMLFGSGYGEAYYHFLAIAPGLIGVTFGGTAARALLLLGHERLYMRIALTVAVISPPLYFFVGKEFGPIGLGLALSVVLVGQQLAAVIVAHKVLGVWSHARLDLKFYSQVVTKVFKIAGNRISKT